MNPYLVLGVPPDADDGAIRQAYLTAVKEATPETRPERFKALVAAYETIKDEPSRHRYALFSTECAGDSPLEVFVRHAQAAPPSPLPFKDLMEILRRCSKM